MKVNLYLILVILLSFLALVKCYDVWVHNAKFNKAQWNKTGEVDPHLTRENMLNDLTRNHQIIGLSHHQLIDSLGDPENYSDKKDSMIYDIIVNYDMIDPRSGTYLTIGFNKDSIATGFNVVQWKNR